MAPEQAQGNPAGPATDVFSAGLVAFCAATGRVYWRSCQGAAPDLAAWQQEIAGPRVAPSARARELGASLLPALDVPLGRALAPNPAERFASVGELAEALAKASAPQKMAMTMPLNAMPLEDLKRMQQQAPVAQAPVVGIGDTLAIASPLEAAPTQWQQPPAQQPSPAAQPPAPPPPQAQPIATPYGGFQAPTPMPQQPPQPQPAPMGAMPMAQAMPGYDAPPESAVVVPKSRTGLYVALAAVGVLVVGGAIAAAVMLGHKSGGAGPAGSGSAVATASSTPPPPATTAPATTASAPTAGDDAGPATGVATGSADAGAPQPEAQDAAPEPENAEITIVCVPAECDSVSVDDNALQDGGLSDPVQLPPGPHTVAVTKTSYDPQKRKLTLKPGQKEKVTFFLSKPGPAPSKPCGKFLERCPN
jgi:hypothetical protein